MGQWRAVVWYRFRTTLRRQLFGYLSVVIIIALIGGLALASLAGARRTESSFSTFLASTSPSDVAVLTGLFQPAPSGYDPALVSRISRLPHVSRVVNEANYEWQEVNRQGYVPASQVKNGPQVTLVSSFGAMFYSVDRPVVLQGRMPKPSRRDEVALTADAARLLHVHLGSHFGIGVVGDVQSTQSCQRCKPLVHVRATVVGIVVTGGGLVIDDADRSPTIFATPAFTRPIVTCCVDPTISFIQVSGGSRNASVVASEISRILPAHLPHVITLTSSQVDATAQRVVGPDAVALLIFGLIVAVVALLIAAQVLGRQIRRRARDLSVLRALGADRATTSLEGLVGVVGAIVAGSLGALIVAVGLSPLAPIGPVGPVYPQRGLAFDWLVLGGGTLLMIVVLTVIAVLLGLRQAPHRVARRRARSAARPSVVARAATNAGLPPSVVCGVRFALVPGVGRQSAPVRSAVFGAVVAISVVVASLTVGASLDDLTSHPALYGWNWSVAITAAGGVGVLPARATATSLNADPDVTAWSGMFFSQAEIDGQSVPVLGATPHDPVAPPILTGHGLDGPHQIVLGAATLAALHKRLGDDVSLTGGAGATRLRIVGTATFPAIGGSPHTEMGVGALFDYHLIPASRRNLFHLPGGGPNIVFVRLRGAHDAQAMARLHRLANHLSQVAQDSVGIVMVQRPAEIANAGTLRATPTLLADSLAAGAVLALGLTLVASVRRRRRDLATLKVLGFTQRQLAITLSWQSLIATLIGLVIGVPVGVLAGRGLWTAFAHSIHAVPSPTVPVAPIALVCAGALAFAVLVAALPGRSAARTPAALVLRAE